MALQNDGTHRMTQEYKDYINRKYQTSNIDMQDLYKIYDTHTVAEANKIIDSMVKASKKLIEDNKPTEIRDITLNVTEFNKLEFYKEREAVARIIQHILVTRKGTYPNNPDFGVGIEDYLFELSTDKLLNELESSIDYQLDKWINSEVKNANLEIKTDVNVIKLNNNSYTTLAIGFKVQDKHTYSKENDYEFTIYYTGNQTNKKILSQLDL